MSKRHPQTKIYEFKPTNDIKIEEIIELCGMIRIGVSGEIVDKFSETLKKFFEEVKDKE